MAGWNTVGTALGMLVPRGLWKAGKGVKRVAGDIRRTAKSAKKKWHRVRAGIHRSAKHRS